MMLATDILDLAPLTGQLVTWIGDGAAFGLAVFGALCAVRIMIKAFKAPMESALDRKYRDESERMG